MGAARRVSGREEITMSHRQLRRAAALAAAVLVVAPCLWAGETASRPPASPAAGFTTLASAAPLWWTVIASWLPFGLPAASSNRQPGGLGGFGPAATCDEGPSIDPSGHCVGRSARRPLLLPTCDAGASIDPSGHCVPRSARRPVLRPTCDEGPSIDPDGRCPGH
jgi:hypothetical protein